VIAVASATKKKYGNLTGNSPHWQYRDLFTVVGVSLKQRPKLYCFSVQRTIQKKLLLAAFNVSSCFARRIIELSKTVPGLNRPLENIPIFGTPLHH